MYMYMYMYMHMHMYMYTICPCLNLSPSCGGLRASQLCMLVAAFRTSQLKTTLKLISGCLYNEHTEARVSMPTCFSQRFYFELVASRGLVSGSPV